MVQLILPANPIVNAGNLRHRPSSAPHHHRASPQLIGDATPAQPQSPRSHRASPRLVQSARPASAPSTHIFAAPLPPQSPRPLVAANSGLVAKVDRGRGQRALTHDRGRGRGRAASHALANRFRPPFLSVAFKLAEQRAVEAASQLEASTPRRFEDESDKKVLGIFDARGKLIRSSLQQEQRHPSSVVPPGRAAHNPGAPSSVRENARQQQQRQPQPQPSALRRGYGKAGLASKVASRGPEAAAGHAASRGGESTAAATAAATAATLSPWPLQTVSDATAATRIQGAERSRRARREVSTRKAQRIAEEAASIEATAQALAESTPELGFLAVAEGLGAQVCKAATRFDERHLKHTGAARRELATLLAEPAAALPRTAFRNELVKVRRNRLVVADDPLPRGPATAAVRARSQAGPWSLDRSVWAPRKRTGNSKDFFETSDALNNMFAHDWRLALRSHGLEWYIIKCHHDSSSWRDLDRNGTHDEVDEVTAMLARYARPIYGAFDHYATLYSEVAGKAEGREGTGESDVFNVTFNAYTVFLRDCALASSTCSIGELEMLFKLVDEDYRAPPPQNALDQPGAPPNPKGAAADDGVDVHNKQGALARKEWLELLVRIAVLKFVKRDARGNPNGDCSDAVERLLHEVLMRKLPGEALQSSNEFRVRCCYLEQVDATLKRHLQSLRALYKVYSAANAASAGFALADDDLMSIGEWMDFCAHMGLFQAQQVSLLEAKYVFVWSRVRTIADQSDRSVMRLRHLMFEVRATVSHRILHVPVVGLLAPKQRPTSSPLPLHRPPHMHMHVFAPDPCSAQHLSQSMYFTRSWPQDFLEAVVRLASVLALPTDSQLELVGEEGETDAGEFLLRLEAHAPREWNQYVERRKRHWSEGEPSQPIWRAVEHLIGYFEHVVRLYADHHLTGRSLKKGESLLLTNEEAAAFYKVLTEKDMAAVRSGEVGDRRLALARKRWPAHSIGGSTADAIASVLPSLPE